MSNYPACRYGCGQIFYRQEKYEVAAYHFEASLKASAKPHIANKLQAFCDNLSIRVLICNYQENKFGTKVGSDLKDTWV